MALSYFDIVWARLFVLMLLPEQLVVAQQRTAAIYSVHNRAKHYLGNTVTTQYALQISVACAMRKDIADSVLGFLCSAHMHRSASKQEVCDELALTSDEWNSIFINAHGCVPSLMQRQGHGAHSTCNELFNKEMELVKSALCLTLAESEPGRLYQSEHIQMLCYIALHFKEAAHAIKQLFGTIVHGDYRRLEHVYAQLDSDPQIILLDDTIQRVVASVQPRE